MNGNGIIEWSMKKSHRIKNIFKYNLKGGEKIGKLHYEGKRNQKEYLDCTLVMTMKYEGKHMDDIKEKKR